MYEDIIEFFHKGITDASLEKVDFAKLNSKAVLLGYVIHPDCCNSATDSWLDTLTQNYNATFYKEWNDVITKSRFELFIDQIMHYATTYGTGFSFGNGYVPNDGAVVPTFTNLKVILPMSIEECATRCLETLKSGVALKQTTMETLCDFFFHHRVEGIDYGLDNIAELLGQIRNKEAMCYLADKFGVYPNDEFGLLRCLVMKYSGSTMLIKGRREIQEIHRAACNFDAPSEKPPLLLLTDKQLQRLSRIFYRFKPIILAMKTRRTAHVVNRIRRLAKVNHRPFQVGFWENIISVKRPLTEVCARLAELDNFRKVRLMALIREKIMFETKSGVFIIRNGKSFVREDYTPKYDLDWLSSLYVAIKTSLVNSLRDKACRVRLPSNINLVLPSSEKTFVGNYPLGCSFKMDKHNVVGVYWRNEWGTRDYDLSMTDLTGRRISWCASFRNDDNSVVFSGDMTSANPEATELIYMSNKAVDGVINLNKFSGNDDSKFRFFYASENLNGLNLLNHMVDPNNVKFDCMVPFDGQGQKTIGIIFGERFYFMDLGSGNRRVATAGKYIEVMLDSFKKKLKGFVNLKEVLSEAGFEIHGDDGEEVDMDFTSPEKDMFIKLLSKEE